MTDLLAVCTLEAVSGRPDDRIVNTFAFHAPGAADLAGNVELAAEAVTDFWEFSGEGIGGGFVLGGYLSSAISRATNASKVAVYDITGKLAYDRVAETRKAPYGHLPPHGSPIKEKTFTLPAARVATNLAPQIACVLSLVGRGAPAQLVEQAGAGPEGGPVIRPRAKRQGRLFIGPLNTDASTNGDGVTPRPSANLIMVMNAAAEKLQQNVNSDFIGAPASPSIWSVWSRTSGSMHAVVETKVDDSFDVIRSRKAFTTTRTTRTFAPVPDLALGA